ncbi:Rieske (2Fe-2S) protein [Aquiluna borgnonia]|jgi:ubiquinol-cytochrome c reductase iron-sulfur subunit|uniref:Cytochrome bc1 complex Rieske iron-sulfur subunit n=1 Tax=Aquiluna borgnonia TaxID=2499157 RepID=A0A7D4PQW0_9MICO|nr:Rieske 2Fe-2S domain-containing protein [Aquiluna borgnonia]QKJ25361.1 Rieske (2Fe-2S) protein [Aquiluna borgnonia]
MSDIEKAYPAGLATNIQRPIADPGIEPHRERLTDKSAKAAKNAELQVSVMFVVSAIGALIAIWGFFAFPIIDGDLSATRNNALWMGVGMALSLLGIGFGAVHWAKTLMPDHEVSEDRHQARSTDEARAKAIEIIKTADAESGFTRRNLIRRSLYGALAIFPIPALVIFGDLGPEVGDTLKHTMWKKGTRLTKDPTGIPIKASEVTIGSVFHVIPEGLNESEHKLEEKAKAAVLLVRVNPGELNEDPAKADWSYDGIVAYSKICTHVGCPVALYEQHTHHLLCPCHQSTFDLAEHCKVVFGPAARPLPQLPIAVDAEGYLVAQSDFLEPVGPSFWDIRQ